MDNRAVAAKVVGAVIGGMAGYLFFTDKGRGLRRQLEPALEAFGQGLGRSLRPPRASQGEGSQDSRQPVAVAPRTGVGYPPGLLGDLVSLIVKLTSQPVTLPAQLLHLQAELRTLGAQPLGVLVLRCPIVALCSHCVSRRA